MNAAREIRFRSLIEAIPNHGIHGGGDPVIQSVDYDSRRVKPGSLFVALRGLQHDGSEFIHAAIRSGAAAIVGETVPDDVSVPYAIVPNARKALTELAWAFFDHPEQQLIMTAVTGTNGKTTIATLLGSVLEKSGLRTGIIGTLGIRYGKVNLDSPRTTPESVDMAAHFAEMVRQNISHTVMEATSIGIDLERTYKLPFRTTIFTNLTRDHLDYHGSWDTYRAAKLRLFREQDSDGTAIINADDPEAGLFVEAANARVVTYGINQEADFRATNLRLQRNGIHFTLSRSGSTQDIFAPLVGRFNVYNLLAVIAAAEALGLSPDAIGSALPAVRPVRGRAEVIPTSAPFTIVIDYAHTPDALEKILATLQGLEHRRIFVIIGAGGNRDKGKRPLMAETAYRLSDRLYLTSDNPRDENPEMILDDMAAGLNQGAEYVRNTDRRVAIEQALAEADDGDIILIAGKGHETYQEIAGVKHPFDDLEVAREWLIRTGYTS